MSSAFGCDNDSEDDEMEAIQACELTSSDGHVWSQEPETIQGRAPVRNIFRDRSGCPVGLPVHPRTRAEAFAMITSAVTLRQTNKAVWFLLGIVS